MKLIDYIPWYDILLIVSLAVTYYFFNRGFMDAFSGQGPILWLHVFGFFVSVLLVLAAVIARVKTAKKKP